MFIISPGSGKDKLGKLCNLVHTTNFVKEATCFINNRRSIITSLILTNKLILFKRLVQSELA